MFRFQEAKAVTWVNIGILDIRKSKRGVWRILVVVSPRPGIVAKPTNEIMLDIWVCRHAIYIRDVSMSTTIRVTPQKLGSLRNADMRMVGKLGYQNRHW